jgi:NAD-dependent SIR2 family protein deacetylase
MARGYARRRTLGIVSLTDAPATVVTARPSEAVALLRSRRFTALTGAGVSTDSGIPDYRGPGAGSRPVTPMTYEEFVSGPRAQQRYWARSFVGWSRMHDAVPNAGHHALARLEGAGHCAGVVTQNVDGLHEQAGSQRLVALHGRIAEVRCLDCGDRISRAVLQREMSEVNPAWLDRYAAAPARPDGDVDVDETAGFVVPDCTRCGGILKPDVVFFGENVPPDRVARCYDLVDSTDALLVLGSSLTVMSGFRFVRHAAKQGVAVVIVNRGRTRGDDLAAHKLEVGTTEFLTDPAWDVARER